MYDLDRPQARPGLRVGRLMTEFQTRQARRIYAHGRILEGAVARLSGNESVGRIEVRANSVLTRIEPMRLEEPTQV